MAASAQLDAQVGGTNARSHDTDAAVNAALNRLAAKASQLYTLPDVYLRVRDLIKDPNSELSELSEVLSRDPGLCARLLRIANSAFFGMLRKIDTISRAIQVIGFQHIYDLVITSSVAKAFKGISNKVINMDAFWVASTERALICRALAYRTEHEDPERLFVAGLLLDIGHLVIYEHLPEQSLQAMETSRQEHRPLHRVEQELLGFNAAELGAELARIWRFPEQLIELIAYQHQPELTWREIGSSYSSKAEIAIVHAANQMSGINHSLEEIELAYLKIDAQARELLKLTVNDYETILANAGTDLQETLSLVIPN